MNDPAQVLDPVRIGYAEAADAWASDAMLAYGPLARHLVDACPLPLDGAIVLDAGAGTGAAGAALAERGARVVSVDLQAEMLRRSGPVPTAVVADVTALPVRDGAFDVVVAAFVLNHLTSPLAGLAEMRRVCRRGGAVLASSYSASRAMAKNVVDDVAGRHGWRRPAWYAEICERHKLVGNRTQMTDVATLAGLVDIEVADEAIDIGLDDPGLVARYRLGLPQFNDFLRSLADQARASLFADASESIAATGETFRPGVVELVARVS